MLEDRPPDAELIVRELQQAGYDPQWTRVETESAFSAEIGSDVDLILSDFNLPQFDGLKALRHLQERKLDIPFIIVSGALGDELVVRCIKQGVTDYLLKDRLARLGLAVTHALEERRLRHENRVVEEQLRQSQKMEAIGQLAGGIAHDFNNILTVINGWSAMLLEDRSASAETREAAKQIFTAGQRAGNLTKQLLFFSRKRPMERVPLDLNATVKEVAAMLRRLIGEHICLELKLAPDLPPIEGDASMIEQILINLSVNARDAMPHGGNLTISTAAREIKDTDRRHADARPGRFICLSVEDTGAGMSEEVLSRIFEPFFTTKDVGKGTGLGLPTIFGIVKQHLGWIEVESRVGRGSRFATMLPMLEKTVTIKKTERPATEPLPDSGTETILIVEDEPSVREFAVAVLRPLGYRVLQAQSGAEALEVWKWHSSRISLLLTDVVMPDEISGPALAEYLLESKPNLGVIFASGYSEEMMERVFTPMPSARFIHKPYSPRQLAATVREALDAVVTTRIAS